MTKSVETALTPNVKPALTPHVSTSSGSGMDRRREIALATILLVVAVLLRLYAATVLPFDQDELYTEVEARDLFATTLLPGIDARPLYYLLQHPLLTLLPRTPLMLRLLSLVFGVVGLWATWRLGRRWLGAQGGLLVLALATVSPWHLYASTTARYYALTYACAALALVAITDAYDSDSIRTYWWAFVVMVIGTLTHPSFVLTIVGAVLGLSLVGRSGAIEFRWPSRRAWMHLWIPYLVVVAIEAVMLRSFGRSSAMANLSTRGLSATLRLIPAMIDWMTVSVFSAAVIGSLLLAFSRSPNRRVGVMTIGAVVGGFALLFAASFRTGVYADYGIGMLPLIFAAAAGAVLWAANDHASGTRSAVVLAIIVAGGAPSIVSYFSDGLRFDYRPAYARIKTEQPGIPVFAWPTALQSEYGPGLKAYELRPDSAYLRQTLAASGEMWAVVSHKRYGIVEDEGRQIERWLGEFCRIVDRYERPRFDYRLYRVELYRCAAQPEKPRP